MIAHKVPATYGASQEIDQPRQLYWEPCMPWVSAAFLLA